MKNNTAERKADEQILHALKLHDAGYNFAEIGRMVGRDRSNISKRVRAALEEIK